MNNQHKEETGLDPTNWEEVRQLGYRMIDDMVAYLKTAGDRPVWSPIPDDVKDTYSEPLPQLPGNIGAIYEEFKQNIFPFSTGNTHPRFFAWVQGGGTSFGALADFMASVMNSNVAIGDHSALYIENQVLGWCKQMFNYPETASGILVSGASIANITALIVARNAASERIKLEGLAGVDSKLVAYCSAETHNCIAKAIEVIGIGSEQLRKIPVDGKYRIDIDALQLQIEQDTQDGFQPFCIVGNAGTVNTGAIDDLNALLHIAREKHVWFHVDGAFGSLAKLVPAYADQLQAIEEADSIAFDLHKWLYMPYEVGCVLFRNAAQHRAAFAAPANYLLAHERGIAGGPESFSNYGMELSRGFKALKVWMSFKENGLQKYSTMIAQNIAQAQYLGSLIEENCQLELLAPVTLNIVCYRYCRQGMSEQELDMLNKELLMRMQERGIAAPSFTLLHGRYTIRVAITNHRTRLSDMDIMVASSVEIGDEIFNERG